MNNVIELNQQGKSTIELFHYSDRDITGCNIQAKETNALCAMLGVLIETIIGEGFLSTSDVYHIVSVATQPAQAAEIKE